MWNEKDRKTIQRHELMNGQANPFLNMHIGTRMAKASFNDVFKRYTYTGNLQATDGTATLFLDVGTGEAFEHYRSADGTNNKKTNSGAAVTDWERIAPRGIDDTTYLTAKGLTAGPGHVFKNGDQLVGMSITVHDSRPDKLKHGEIVGGVFSGSGTMLPNMATFGHASNATGDMFGVTGSGASEDVILHALNYGIVPMKSIPLQGIVSANIAFFMPKPELGRPLDFTAAGNTTRLGGAPVLTLMLKGTADAGTPTTTGISYSITYWTTTFHGPDEYPVPPADGSFTGSDIEFLNYPEGMGVRLIGS